MPFDGIADPVAAKSLQALDLMEDRLEGGRKWTRHFMFRDGGKMCLLGASYFGCNIGAGRRADRALEYLARAIRPRSRAKDWSDRCWVETTIVDFNDNCCWRRRKPAHKRRRLRYGSSTVARRAAVRKTGTDPGLPL